MMLALTRREILDRLHEKIKAGIPIVGAGAGTGLSARCEAQGGSDLLIAYATGRCRMAGRSSLAGRFAFGDANGQVLDLMEEIVPMAGTTPVLAGVFAQDPYRDLSRLLGELKELGCSGVQNIPGVGGQAAMEGQTVAEQMERAGLGFERETALVRRAREMDMITTPYCSQPAHVRLMAEAGADVFVLHMGLTGRQSDKRMAVTPLDQCAERIERLAALALELNGQAIVLAHGGPIVEPADLRYLMDRCPDLHGFYGASSIERVPVEGALADTVRSFKRLKKNQ